MEFHRRRQRLQSEAAVPYFKEIFDYARTLDPQHRPLTYTNLLMAAVTMSVIPMILIFVFMQKQLVKGIMLGGVKG